VRSRWETDLTCKVGVAGLGVIGAKVARRLTEGLEGMTLVAVTSGGQEKAERTLAAMGAQSPRRLAGRAGRPVRRDRRMRADGRFPEHRRARDGGRARASDRERRRAA